MSGKGARWREAVFAARAALTGSGAPVPPGRRPPDGKITVGVPARIVGEVTGTAKEWADTTPEAYRDLARRHAASVRPV